MNEQFPAAPVTQSMKESITAVVASPAAETLVGQTNDRIGTVMSGKTEATNGVAMLEVNNIDTRAGVVVDSHAVATNEGVDANTKYNAYTRGFEGTAEKGGFERTDTFITRTDTNGNEVYKHRSKDPRVAQLAGSLAAKQLVSPTSNNGEQKEAA
jgi:hypothetical protein